MDGDGIEFVRVTTAAASSDTRALTLQAAAAGAEGDENASERFDGVEVCQPLGLMASPTITATTEAVCVRRGDELVALVLIDKGGAAQSVEAGETRLYGSGSSNATAVIRIRADGAVEITAKSGQDIRITTAGAGNVEVTSAAGVSVTSGTGDITLNSGVLKVARATDSVNETVGMASWMFAVATAINTLAPGSVTPTVPTSFGSISPAAGAAKVKA